jgi:hypothetical protein
VRELATAFDRASPAGKPYQQGDLSEGGQEGFGCTLPRSGRADGQFELMAVANLSALVAKPVNGGVVRSHVVREGQRGLWSPQDWMVASWRALAAWRPNWNRYSTYSTSSVPWVPTQGRE